MLLAKANYFQLAALSVLAGFISMCGAMHRTADTGVKEIEQESLTATVAHVPVGKWAKIRKPLYDETCPVMKARYNCQLDQRQKMEYLPADILIWGALDPPLIAHHCQKNSSRPFTVLLTGNSFIRQVFESLVCLWPELVTGGIQNIGGPSMTWKDLKKSINASGTPRVFCRTCLD